MTLDMNFIPTPPNDPKSRGLRFIRNKFQKITKRETGKPSGPGSMRDTPALEKLIKENGQNYQFATKELRQDKDFALKALQWNVTVIAQLPESLINDVQFMLGVVKESDEFGRDLLYLFIQRKTTLLNDEAFRNGLLEVDPKASF